MSRSHQARLSTSVDTFRSAMQQMIAALDGLSDAAATRVPAGGGWNAAQIGWHVGQSNELLAGALTGAVPMAQPTPEDFVENPSILGGLPAKVPTWPHLEPAATVTRAQAIDKLRDSIPIFVGAAQSLTERRCTTHCVPFPFGTLSMYQFIDFGGGHVVRHQDQLEKVVASV